MLEFEEDTNRDEMKGVEVIMKLKIKTNENINLFLISINSAIKKFIDNWMNTSVPKQIKLICHKKTNSLSAPLTTINSEETYDVKISNKENLPLIQETRDVKKNFITFIFQKNKNLFFFNFITES
jgi:hypothetical protein